MNLQERNDELDRIIDRLNEMYNQEQDLEEFGALDLEMALDFRADSWNGDGDCPEPTSEELQRIQDAVDRNCEILSSNHDERLELYYRYNELAHTSPHRYENGGYARSWHEKY